MGTQVGMNSLYC